MKKLIRLLFLVILFEYIVGNVCSEMTANASLGGKKCSDFLSDDDKFCIDNLNIDSKNQRSLACLEIYCWEITEDMHLSCSDFPVLNNKACIEAGANEATKCKQEPLCEGAAGDSDEDCSKYIVQIGKEDSLICLFDQNKKKCFEQYFCE